MSVLAIDVRSMVNLHPDGKVVTTLKRCAEKKYQSAGCNESVGHSDQVLMPLRQKKPHIQGSA